MGNPLFKVGELVQFGYGKIPHRVIAITTTGRIPTYDVECQEGLRKYFRRQGVPQQMLNHYYPRNR